MNKKDKIILILIVVVLLFIIFILGQGYGYYKGLDVCVYAADKLLNITLDQKMWNAAISRYPDIIGLL